MTTALALVPALPSEPVPSPVGTSETYLVTRQVEYALRFPDNRIQSPTTVLDQARLNLFMATMFAEEDPAWADAEIVERDVVTRVTVSDWVYPAHKPDLIQVTDSDPDDDEDPLTWQ